MPGEIGIRLAAKALQNEAEQKTQLETKIAEATSVEGRDLSVIRKLFTGLQEEISEYNSTDPKIKLKADAQHQVATIYRSFQPA